jgi:hypothetical protein
VSSTEQSIVFVKDDPGQRWSAGLIAETRAALEHPEPFVDGYVHLKNRVGTYGRISVEDLLARRFPIQDKVTLKVAEFPTIDSVLLADWAID